MKLIKLDAIDSTNDFLKSLSQNQTLENFTVVTTKKQIKGKGQHGSKWLSEESNNLITSILISNTLSDIKGVFNLNIAVGLAIISALNKFKIPSLSIKWPNDIMSENKKIAGILIENLIKSNGKIDSIVGIGLNINQTDFKNLPKASSLKNITGNEFDVQELLFEIVSELKQNVSKIKPNEIDALWKTYEEKLFKRGFPAVFEDPNKQKFMGIIEGVSRNGKLKLLLEDDSKQEYGIKEISLIY